jgi:hypothetical protein
MNLDWMSIMMYVAIAVVLYLLYVYFTAKPTKEAGILALLKKAEEIQNTKPINREALEKIQKEFAEKYPAVDKFFRSSKEKGDKIAEALDSKKFEEAAKLLAKL